MLSGLRKMKERQMMLRNFLVIFNDLMCDKNFPGLHSVKVFLFLHRLDGNTYLSCIGLIEIPI